MMTTKVRQSSKPPSLPAPKGKKSAKGKKRRKGKKDDDEEDEEPIIVSALGVVSFWKLF